LTRSATRDRAAVGRKARQPDPTSQALHDKLGRLIDRKRSGRTNAEIAEAAGISATHLNQILRGEKANPGVLTVQAILAALPATWSDYDRA
jgi:transcriptional regulator with XRE-family HTH domain